MKILPFLKVYIPTFLVLFMGNFVAQMMVLANFNGPYLAGITRPAAEFVYIIPVILYAIHAKVVYFLSSRLKVVPGKYNGFLVGGGYGVLVFLHANVINMFILPYWPWQVTVADTISAAIIFGLAGMVAAWLKAKVAKAD